MNGCVSGTTTDSSFGSARSTCWTARRSRVCGVCRRRRSGSRSFRTARRTRSASFLELSCPRRTRRADWSWKPRMAQWPTAAHRTRRFLRTSWSKSASSRSSKSTRGLCSTRRQWRCHGSTGTCCSRLTARTCSTTRASNFCGQRRSSYTSRCVSSSQTSRVSMLAVLCASGSR